MIQSGYALLLRPPWPLGLRARGGADSSVKLAHAGVNEVVQLRAGRRRLHLLRLLPA